MDYEQLGHILESIHPGVTIADSSGVFRFVSDSYLSGRSVKGSDIIGKFAGSEEMMEIYTSGATNIFKYPELSDKQSAQEIISAFEEKQQLADLVTETLASEENHGIQVYIGDEAPVKTMKDCSVVTATYELGEGMKGTIGIIGPKRMDYEHVMKTLKTLQSELDAIYNKEPKG